jgi:hypothetical protein
MATPECTALNDYFVTESGRFIDKISERGRMKSWWSSLGGNGIPSEPYPDGMGLNFNNVIWERSGRVGGGWAVQALSSGGTPSCLPEAGIVSPANTVRTSTSYKQLLYSEYICLEDVRRGYEFKQQVTGIRDNFQDQIIDEWEQLNREQYVTLGKNKVIFNPQLPNNTTGTTMTDFPAQEPTSPITQNYLDHLRFLLNRNSAAIDGGAYAMEDGQPIYMVVMSPEQQQSLFQSGPNTENQSSRINQDLRYTSQADKLLKAYGVNRTYHGWFHMIDYKAPHYNFVNGAWVHVPFYTTAAATTGTQLVVNPDYESADYELVIVFLPTAISRMVPKTFTSGGDGATFKAWDYAGAVQWINEYDKTCNPLGNMGYFAAQMQATYNPKKIENAWSIMVKRCPRDFEMVTCTNS